MGSAIKGLVLKATEKTSLRAVPWCPRDASLLGRRTCFSLLNADQSQGGKGRLAEVAAVLSMPPRVGSNWMFTRRHSWCFRVGSILQARIAGLLHGTLTVEPRAPRLPGSEYHGSQ